MEKVVRPGTAQRLHPPHPPLEPGLLPLDHGAGFLCYVTSPPPPPRWYHLGLSDCVYLESDRSAGHVWSMWRIPGALVEGLGRSTASLEIVEKGMYYNSNGDYEHQSCSHPPSPDPEIQPPYELGLLGELMLIR